MPKLLIIDTETGGLDPELHSILSLGAVVWEDGKIGESFEVLITEPTLVVSPKALAVNRIDLVKHSEQAVSPVEAMKRFQEFLDLHFRVEGVLERIQLAGHNVPFDISFLRRLCQMAAFPYDEYFSHRVTDTASLIRFLVLAKKITITGAKLSDAFQYFGIVCEDKDRHTALADAKCTAILINKLIETVNASTAEAHVPSA